MSILYTKNSKQLIPSKISLEQFNNMNYGDVVETSSVFSSSIEFLEIPDYKIGAERGDLFYLNNILLNYKIYSEKYDPSYYSESDVKMIKIPSIYFGSYIRKESVKLQVFYTGSLMCCLEDIAGNGELKQTYPSSSNYDTKGVVLYNHGIILLTGSDTININNLDYYSGSILEDFKWIYFGTGSLNTTSTLFDLQFKGTELKPTLSINIPLEKENNNFSNNPTSFEYSVPTTGSIFFKEDEYSIPINTASSSYHNMTGTYQKSVYITKIGIYDKNKNLIGIAKLANPILKKEDREYNFKLKLDL